MSYCSSRHQNLAYRSSMGHRTAVLYSEGHVQCTLPKHLRCTRLLGWTPIALLARGRHLLCRIDHILKNSCSATRNQGSGRQSTVRLSLCWMYSPMDRLLLHSNRRSNTHVQNSSAPLSLPTALDRSSFEAYTFELRNCRKGAASVDKVLVSGSKGKGKKKREAPSQNKPDAA